MIKKGEICSENVHTVYIQLASRVPNRAPSISEKFLERHQVESGNFLLFPANMWQHKNHQMLLTAFGMYHSSNRHSDLKLVFTGHPSPRMETLRDAAERMGLSGRVVFAKYLKLEEFASLIHACKAVIFPSLYEGFGMPVVEAMALGKPVLCSHMTSLPEIARDAAIYFDPKRPQTIVDAIFTLETDNATIEKLIVVGRERAKQFCNGMQMAKEYWDIFQKTAGSRRFASNQLTANKGDKEICH